MDMHREEEIEAEKRNEDGLQPEWGSVLVNEPMATWDHHANLVNLGVPSCDTNVSMVWTQPNTILRVGTILPLASGMAPQILPHFPDSDFIHRAARISFFNGGNSDHMDPYSVTGLTPLPTQKPRGGIPGNEINESTFEAKERVEVFGNVSEEPENSVREVLSEGGESSAKEHFSKKRKQMDDAAKDISVIQQDVDQKLLLTASKQGGQNGKSGSRGASESPSKEEYIHVRARRGQATNSHSLAERVRREKISQRMKFLQDLVPGCDKVTGKAVMLDEIINYVQSLQRQVEFLSMKLATVIPRMDFNIDGILPKDVIPSQAGPSLVTFPPLNLLPQYATSMDAMPRIASTSGAYKYSTPQVPNVWDNELHNAFRMGFTPNSPLNGQHHINSLPSARKNSES